MSTRSEKTEIWYEARVRLYQVKFASGAIARREDQIAYLGESEGYPAICDKPKKFSTKEEIIENWLKWDGMPWWNRIKPGSLEIFMVTETIIREISRTQIVLEPENV